MADKLVTAVKKSRADVWSAFKKGISLQGYKYYQPHQEIKYRYPAPGSVALDDNDKRHLEKVDWKTPYKNTNYYVRPTTPLPDDEDPAVTTNHISAIPHFDGSHPRFAKYEQAVLDAAVPELKSTVMHPELEVGSDALKDHLWGEWNAQADYFEEVREQISPGTLDFDDAYNQ